MPITVDVAKKRIDEKAQLGLDPVAIFSSYVDEDDGNSLAEFDVVVVRGRRRHSFDIHSKPVPRGSSPSNRSPDFEAPGDANRNNVYEVTVQSTDSGANTGSLDITVTVGNVEEPGVVTLSNRAAGGRHRDYRQTDRSRRGRNRHQMAVGGWPMATLSSGATTCDLHSDCRTQVELKP